MKRKILNLFAGIGGNRTLWEDCEVTAVEIDEMIAEIYRTRFPGDEMVIGDAYQYLEDNYQNFDIIWASPPCPTHSRTVTFHERKLPDMRLYSIIIFLKYFFKGTGESWVVENVIPFYRALIKPSAVVGRHCFWSNRQIRSRKFRKPSNKKDMTYPHWRQLCRYHEIDPEIFNDSIIKYGWTDIEIRRILRNCVHKDIGRFVINDIIKKKQKELIVKWK